MSGSIVEILSAVLFTILIYCVHCECTHCELVRHISQIKIRNELDYEINNHFFLFAYVCVCVFAFSSSNDVQNFSNDEWMHIKIDWIWWIDIILGGFSSPCLPLFFFFFLNRCMEVKSIQLTSRIKVQPQP